MEVPSYTKILTLGARGTERALVGPVVVQEKVDGSQFSFGVDVDGNIGCRSHHQQIALDAPSGMFASAVNHVLKISQILQGCSSTYGECWFYCEYLQKPKHNTLTYARVPKNHLVLFDAFVHGDWRHDLQWTKPTKSTCEYTPIRFMDWLASALEIDLVPELHRGPISAEELKGLLTTPSFLGGQTVEGLVIKNYNELIAIGGRTYPVFCKLVNEAFKERHSVDWKDRSTKGKLETYLESFRTEARWQKAVQRMREDGSLEYQPRDIGSLVRSVQEDIREEETENIKEELYKLYVGDIVRISTRGLAEWYKEQLLTRTLLFGDA